MQFDKMPTNPNAVRANRRVEAVTNAVLRGRDRLLARLHLGGRAADYDDVHYEFVGGAGGELRRKHYDRSLRLLWKAEAQAPWSSFHDMTQAEHAVREMALRAMNDDERAAHQRMTTAEFRAKLDEEYTPRQKQAIVRILTAIGHGEAYAWLVSSEVLRLVRSSGAKAAVTMQVLEEAKHFVVMRELIQAFGVDVPRQSAWEYLLLEGVLKAEGLDKLFGMNVLVETIAQGIFGLFAHLPGLEVLRMFHLDESRHTGLPANYFHEFPMTRWQLKNPVKQVKRLSMALPSIPLIALMEEDLAELGIDAFDFAGSALRKMIHLAERSGFTLPLPRERLLKTFNAIFNMYCRATRAQHTDQDYMAAETVKDAAVLAVEHEQFHGPHAAA